MPGDVKCACWITAVQVNAASLCDADEDAISLPLSLQTDCTLGDTEQHCTSSEELCLSNALMEGRCLIVCEHGLTSCKNTTVTNFSSGGLFLKGKLNQE